MFESTCRLLIACLIVVAAETATSMADDLLAFPERLELTSADDQPQVVVQRRLADGSTRDVTSSSTWTFQDTSVARKDDAYLVPLRDGETTLTIVHEGLKCVVPVTVRNAESVTPPRFRNDVLAVLTRAGCNSGKCHGSASGKDGFRLSLYGFDPVGDQYRLTQELNGRRLNLATPARSLVLKKALGEVAHSGGQRLVEDSAHYRTVMAWIAAGAPIDPPDVPVPVGIDVYPGKAIFSQPGPDQQLVVRARYSDGTDRDVTDLAVFISNNEGVAAVSEYGLVTATGPGAAFVLARFDQFSTGTSIIVRPGTSFQFPQVETRNYIDELVDDQLKDMHLSPSPICQDEEFLRRATLDLIGVLPTEKERESFLADHASNRRERLVESLLNRPEFLEIWAMKWAELLQLRIANGGSRKGLALYDQWLRDQVRRGRTINQIIAELIPASGGTFENPAAGYYQTETTPQLIAENVAQALLGTRIQCAQCHNHPFDRWTLDDYYGFASFFSQVGYKQAQDPRELTIFNAATGQMRHPVSNRLVAPRYLGGGDADVSSGDDYRRLVAGWLTSPRNTAFSEHLANVVWAHFMGIGVVEPVDDVRVSNPPSNPSLYRAIGQKFAEYEFEVKKLVKDICASRTYQLSSQRTPANRLDERNFSHATVRRLRAEVLLDCINQVTEVNERFPGLPMGAKAVQIQDGRSQNYFLTTFGRSTRETACSCEVKTSPTLSQALHLLNGESTSGKIESGGVVTRLVQEHQSPMTVVQKLYVRCLTRLPTSDESLVIQERLAGVNDPETALTDLFWALLNSNEFYFNH